jgi:hypothetical protein
MEKKISKHGAYVPDTSTLSFRHFYAEIEQTEFLMFFLFISDDYISENKEEARQTLIEAYDDPENEVSSKLIEFFKSEKADKIFDMLFYERHFSQMAYSRSIDNFISYFKDILAEVVIKKPQVLKSKDQERLDFILSFDNIESMLKAISEKKIEELFYKGITDIEKFFNDRLGIEIFKDQETKKAINKLIKQRNLIVHNRGRVTKEFLEEFPNPGLQEGQYLVFKYQDISLINLELNNFLAVLDNEIATKFSLTLVNNE